MKPACLFWFCLLILICFTESKFFAQNNLVLNGSFEEIYSCPVFTQSMSNPEINLAKFWSSPTYSSPDLFHSCNTSLVPLNTRGFQYPRTGEGYAGFVAFAIYWNNDREYIQGTLMSALTENQEYYVEFYVSLGRVENRYPVSNIDIYFSDTLVYYGSTIALSMFEPQVKNERSNIIKDTLNWVKISGTFTAKGGGKIFYNRQL